MATLEAEIQNTLRLQEVYGELSGMTTSALRKTISDNSPHGIMDWFRYMWSMERKVSCAVANYVLEERGEEPPQARYLGLLR